MLGKNFLARLRIELGEIARVRAQHKVALLDLGEPEILKDFGDGKELIHLELQGARDFAKQMQERMSKGWGSPGDDDGSVGDVPDKGDRDPFGRPLSSNGSYDQGDVAIPDAGILQKSRQILDELRRRAGERSRPAIELDYIDRLLRRF